MTFLLGTIYGAAAMAAGFLLGSGFKAANPALRGSPTGGPVMLKRSKGVRKPKVRDDGAAFRAEQEEG